MDRALIRSASLRITKVAGAFPSLSIRRGPGTQRAAFRRCQVCAAPTPGVARYSMGLVTRTPVGTSELPAQRPDPCRRRRHFPGQREEGELRSRPPTPPSPPPHVRPGGPRQPHAEESARRPPDAVPRVTVARESPKFGLPPCAGMSPSFISFPSAPRPRELPGSPLHTWRDNLHSWLLGQVTARGGEDARKSGPCHPLAARSGGRAATGALAALHMRRCLPSQGPPRSGPSGCGTTFPISLWGQTVGTFRSCFAEFRDLDDRWQR